MHSLRRLSIFMIASFVCAAENEQVVIRNSTTCIRSQSDLQPLINATLLREIDAWRAKYGNLDAQALKNVMRARFVTSDIHAEGGSLLLIRNGKVYAPLVPPQGDVQDRRFKWTMEFLQRAMRQGIRFPNVAWWMAVRDGNPCVLGERGCEAPILSFFKTTRDADGTGNILVPTTNDVGHRLYDFPWSSKKDVAFFRGGSYCQPTKLAGAIFTAEISGNKSVYTCSRSFLRDYKENFQKYANMLDFQIVQEPSRIQGNDRFDLQTSNGAVPISEHSRWKFLLSLDGATCSERFAKLLHANSVVLKEESHWSEYFYAALVPGKHYLAIFNFSVFDTFETMLAYSQRQGDLRAIATAGQEFAAKYLCRRARAMYFSAALFQYKELFSTKNGQNHMDDFIETELWPQIKDFGVYSVI